MMVLGLGGVGLSALMVGDSGKMMLENMER